MRMFVVFLPMAFDFVSGHCSLSDIDYYLNGTPKKEVSSADIETYGTECYRTCIDEDKCMEIKFLRATTGICPLVSINATSPSPDMGLYKRWLECSQWDKLTFECDLKYGDGISSREIFIDPSGDLGNCVRKCFYHKNVERGINGLTLSATRGCFCEVDMVDRNNANDFKSCYFNL